MKYFSLIILSMLFSCEVNENSSGSSIHLVMEYYNAVNEGNVANAGEIVTENFTKINNDKKFEETGPELFMNSIRNHQKDNKEYRFIVDDIFGSNDRVAVRWKWESININSGTEKKVVSQGIAIFEIKNNKIDKLWQGFDLLGFTKQLSGS